MHSFRGGPAGPNSATHVLTNGTSEQSAGKASASGMPDHGTIDHQARRARGRSPTRRAIAACKKAQRCAVGLASKPHTGHDISRPTSRPLARIVQEPA
jgi:hypothetical protein